MHSMLENVHFASAEWKKPSPWLMTALFLVLFVLGTLTVKNVIPLDVHNLTVSSKSVHEQGVRLGIILAASVAVTIAWAIANWIVHGKADVWLKNHYGTIFWKFTHFLLAFVIGMFAPSYALVGLSIMVLWEIFECYFIDWKRMSRASINCAGWTDVATNTIGIITGLGVSFAYNGNLDKND